MANEIKFGYLTGKTLHYNVFQTNQAGSANHPWDNTNSDFTDAWSAGGVGQETSLTEQATNSAVYMANLPTNFGSAPAGEYLVVIRDDADNTPIGQQALYWDGTQEVGAAAWELAQTSLSYKDEAAVATDMLGAIAQLWRRFFNQVTKDGSDIKTYNSSDTLATTQGYTEDVGGVDTVEKAT